MTIQRVAVIFDNTARPETTGVYIRRALGKHVEVEHFLPTELGRLAREQFDLHLFVDDGLRYPIPKGLARCAYWAIDTHLDLDWPAQRGGEVDWLFAAQRDGAEKLQQRGLSDAVWLPLACDPQLHGKHTVAKEHDVCFIGNLSMGPRMELVQLLQQNFPSCQVGRAYFEEMARIYSASRIVFNCSILNDVNMRVFEGLASGSLLVTNDLSENGQSDLFKDGVHLVSYTGAEELLDKVRFYLAHEKLRENIAAVGRAEVLAHHTYSHRVATILETVEQSLSRKTFGVSALPAAKVDSPSSNQPLPTKDWSYFEFARPEVVALIPESASRVLDVGCSAGRLGLTLKQRQPCHITGIEVNPEAAATARTRLDDVLVGSIESDEIDFPDSSFDCIICADVLEHLRDPLKVLGKLRRWLTPDGSLVSSVPNVRHHTVVRSLIEGNFTYESAGLLDDTHLQFWTWRDLRRLFDRSGFELSQQHFVPGGDYADWKKGNLDEVTAGPFQLRGLAPEEAEQFYAYQYLIRATPRKQNAPGLTSIILVTHNQWQYTARCLETIRSCTDEAYEIIVVDNASSDETVERLSACDEVRLLKNVQNRGFPAAVNQGLAVARGEQLLLLNNDVLVTSGWLRRLLAALHSAPEVGLVGPCTNSTAGAQRVKVTYPLRELEDFAWRWADKRKDRRQEVSELTGFCLLFRREVLDQIGEFDERFGVGVYEDVDFCRRAQQEGFRLVIAEDAYVHHFGHRSFHGAGIDQDALAVESERKFREKWNASGSNDEAIPNAAKDWSPPPLPDEERLFLAEDERTRNAMLDRIPGSAHRILVLGEDPLLVESLRSRAGVTVEWMVEPAGTIAHGLTAGDAILKNESEWPWATFGEPFNCVIWSSLAASPDPRPVLGAISLWLKPEGTFLVSVPNVRNREIVSSLLRGTWAPALPGSAEKSLRFFTRREIEKLLFRHGFDLRKCSIPEEQQTGQNDARQRGKVQLDQLTVAGLERRAVDEFFADCIIVEATPAPIVNRALTSIILVTFNELEYTRRCLDSLRLRTVEPCEVIVVDNGSTDGTPDYLRALGGVRLIENRENRGFPAAANQGIRAARGDYLLLLNNDTVVTSGWLRRMLDAFDRDASVGLVGPCSNRCSGPQEIPVNYDRLEGLDGFAWDWGQSNDRKTVEYDRLVGFCLLFRRAVVDRIGLLDERFGIGNFEDDDYCRRALNAGFKTVIAVDAFVHHFGGRTFLGSGVDFAGLMAENQRKYEEKWKNADAPSPVPNGKQLSANGEATPPKAAMPPAASTRPRLTVRRAPGGGLLLQSNTIRLSLCMIVRDNETTIGPCLKSIRPFVDEIIVVDTGCEDRTPEICREFGARLHEFPWCDDFSAARNESLKYARGEWIFWMDSDDTIPEECGRQLRALTDGDHDPAILGYIMQVHCPGPSEEGGAHRDVTVVDHVKLIRNRPDLRFEGRIHEQLLPAIRRACGEVAWTDLHVVHSGSDHSPETRKRKLERDYRILHRELEERPDHPFVLFNLGMTYADGEEYPEAVQYLEKCLSVSRPEESHLRKAYSLLISSLGQAERHDEAWRRCQEGLQLYPDDKELLFRSAILHHHFGRLRQAEATYLRLMEPSENRYFQSIDQGLDGYKARHNLALVYDDMGRLDKAEEQWRRIVDEVPEYIVGWRQLGELLLRQQKESAVEEIISFLQRQGSALKREALLLRGKVHASRGDVSAAVHIFDEFSAAAHHDVDGLRHKCRLLFESGHWAEADVALQELIARDPTDAAALHNLGATRLQQSRFQEAADAFRKSLNLRPDSNPTTLQLQECLLNLGVMHEAACDPGVDRFRSGKHLSECDLKGRVVPSALGEDRLPQCVPGMNGHPVVV